MKKNKLAIFDIDGTIFRSALFLQLIYELVKKGIFPKKILEEVEDDYLAWVNRKGAYMSYALKIVDIYNEKIKGHREADIKKASKEVIREQSEKVYRFTRELIKDLKKKNYLLLAVSGSPEPIVSEFTKHYGFDNYFATTFEVKRGIFTGVTGGVKFQKNKIVEQFFIDHPEITKKGSVGVGDTKSDIAFLNLVESPIAFNPDMELAKYAKEKKWRIVVERKDVIYDVKKFETIS